MSTYPSQATSPSPSRSQQMLEIRALLERSLIYETFDIRELFETMNSKYTHHLIRLEGSASNTNRCTRCSEQQGIRQTPRGRDDDLRSFRCKKAGSDQARRGSKRRKLNHHIPQLRGHEDLTARNFGLSDSLSDGLLTVVT